MECEHAGSRAPVNALLLGAWGLTLSRLLAPLSGPRLRGDEPSPGDGA